MDAALYTEWENNRIIDIPGGQQCLTYERWLELELKNARAIIEAVDDRDREDANGR